MYNLLKLGNTCNNKSIKEDYMRRNARLRKNNLKSLDDKIPIQVKGHRDDENKEINRKSIQYPVELAVLQNYYNDKGVLYFRILISDTKKEIFYSILYPSKIKYYVTVQNPS